MSKKTLQSKSLGVIIVLGVITIGLLLGYGLFLATSNNKEQSKEALESAQQSAISNQEFAEQNQPEIDTYEGSESEQRTIRDITEDEKDVLRDTVGDEGYVNTAYGYAFTPPEGWYEDRINSEISPSIYYSTYDPLATSIAADIPGVKFEALVQDNYKDQTLDEWISDGHQFASEVYSSEKISIGEYEAYREAYDYNGDTITVTFLKGSDVYIFSMYGESEELEKHKTTFDQIINSLIVL